MLDFNEDNFLKQMKRIKKHYFWLLICSSFYLLSCVNDDFSVPKELGTAENESLNILLEDIASGEKSLITISELKQQFVSGQVLQITSDVVLKGYVASSDKTGNFYKELYIQDLSEQPTAAVLLVLNQVDTYNQFNIGREVYIVLKDLFLGETASEIIAIGGAIDGSRVDMLSERQIKSHLFRSALTETIMPLPINFSDLNDNYIGMFVSIDDVEFPEVLTGQSYFNAQDDFDTQRVMQRCEGFSYEQFLLETSSFATFKNEILPTENGKISGIVTRSYGGDDLVLVLNDSKDVRFENARCSPLSTDDFTIVFEERFSDAIDETILDTEGWVNVSERGQVLWTEQVYSKNGYAEFGTFGANDTQNVGWLISPPIDMSATKKELLNFKTAQHHLESVKNTIEVLVSVNFNGTDPLSADWQAIDAKLPTKYDEWYVFKDSGLIDISTFGDEQLHVAFRVTGSGTNLALDGAYQLDDFRVLLER